ncbi:MAG: SCP2 sterol-binding domain-containing protein [Bacteroidia bacterium]|nr:SCP2 sterol-binding domain-containing protein [Bacteroidia bacterium]
MTLESLIEKITQQAAAADSLGSTLKFDFGNDEIIYLDGSGEDNVVSTENKDADCVVEITKEDLGAMMTGDLNPMAAFMEQKLKVKGDMGVAMKLQSLIS